MGSRSKVVAEELRSLFSQFGLLESIVLDNGTCFTSSEFESFLKLYGITRSLRRTRGEGCPGCQERFTEDSARIFP